MGQQPVLHVAVSMKALPADCAGPAAISLDILPDPSVCCSLRGPGQCRVSVCQQNVHQ